MLVKKTFHLRLKEEKEAASWSPKGREFQGKQTTTTKTKNKQTKQQWRRSKAGKKPGMYENRNEARLAPLGELGKWATAGGRSRKVFRLKLTFGIVLNYMGKSRTILDRGEIFIWFHKRSFRLLSREHITVWAERGGGAAKREAPSRNWWNKCQN